MPGTRKLGRKTDHRMATRALRASEGKSRVLRQADHMQENSSSPSASSAASSRE